MMTHSEATKSMTNKIAINQNMFSQLVKNVIMYNLNRASIVAMDKSGRGERHPYPSIAVATKEF
jgi:hypothetical protein